MHAHLLRDGSLSDSIAPLHVRAARPRDIYGLITKICGEGLQQKLRHFLAPPVDEGIRDGMA